MSLFSRLPDGPLDIVGDVHGEYDALRNLMDCLGYDRDCNSPDGRHLVFLGDLIDRGPDSPAVVESVMAWVAAGRASCILGNHELLALISRPLHGNGWLIQPNPIELDGEFRSRIATPMQRTDFLEFFDSLPVVLENDNLRLVHACWHFESVTRLRGFDRSCTSPKKLYDDFEKEVPAELHRSGLHARMENEKLKYLPNLNDRCWGGRVLVAHAEAEVRSQLVNPLRVMTSGALEVAEEAFYAMGQWRMANRRKWWDAYDEETPVVIGHFWRRFNVSSTRVSGVFGKDVFEGIGSHEWMGKHQNVYCVDYSVGQRHAERTSDSGNGAYNGKLAALRFPEWEVYHDDGTVVPIRTP